MMEFVEQFGNCCTVESNKLSPNHAQKLPFCLLTSYISNTHHTYRAFASCNQGRQSGVGDTRDLIRHEHSD